jgi:photosystem II stability/assembly factor-like uncharacterized protein
MSKATIVPPITLLFAASIILGMVGGSAHAQEGGLVETFDDPTLPRWEHSPNAQVIDGALRIDPPGFAFHPGRWADLTLEVSARFLADTTLGIGYSSTDQGEYTLRIEPGRLTLQRNGSQLAEVELERVPPGEWMRVAINVHGGHHEIRRGDRPALTATDPDPLPPGGLMLRVVGEAAGEFDDLTLTAAAAPPASPEPTPDEGAAATPLASPEPTQIAAASGRPAYQAGEWVRLYGPPGGLGYDIRMRPDNPDVMYVTDANSGLHVSVDGGRTWRASNSGVAAGSTGEYKIFCVTIDPHDYDVVWIGTQDTGHIYRSSDGGATWELRDEGLAFDDQLRSVRGITIDPNDPPVVYAALEVLVYAWQGGRIGGWPSGGEVYKSIDGGLHWQLIWSGDSLARYVWIDPRNSDRVYVSTGIFDRDAANSNIEAGDYGGVGILRSDDGGRTWTVLDERNGLGGRFIPSLFMHPEDPETLLAAVTYPAQAEGAYVTHDGGDTWTQALARDPWQGMDAVEISTADPNIWYAAAENVIYRSEDAGQTWEHYFMGTADRGGGVAIDLQADPRDPMRLFVNAYGGGNFVTTNGGETWVDASQGYTGSFNPGLAVAPGTGWTVLAGSNTGAFRSTDGGQTWVGLGMGSMTRLFVSILLLPAEQTGGPQPILASDNNGTVWLSTDDGATWEHTPLVGEEAAMIQTARLAAAPSDPRIIYAGFVYARALESNIRFANIPSFGLYRSTDAGRTWQVIPAVSFADAGILALAVSPDDPEMVYAATGAGVYLSRDGGDTWRHLDALETSVFAIAEPASAEEGLIVEDIVMDPFDAQRLLAAVMDAGVYRSEDGGETWTQASAGLDPNEPVYDLVADPNRAGVFYVSSWQSGVFATTDHGGSWQLLADGLDFFGMRALALSEDGTVLYAGTRGGGVFRLGTPVGSPPAAGATPSGPPPSTSPGELVPTHTPQPATESGPTRRLPTGGVVLGLVLGGTILVALVLAFSRLRRR